MEFTDYRHYGSRTILGVTMGFHGDIKGCPGTFRTVLGPLKVFQEMFRAEYSVSVGFKVLGVLRMVPGKFQEVLRVAVVLNAFKYQGALQLAWNSHEVLVLNPTYMPNSQNNCPETAWKSRKRHYNPETLSKRFKGVSWKPLNAIETLLQLEKTPWNIT